MATELATIPNKAAALAETQASSKPPVPTRLPGVPQAGSLTRRQKAAIVVRLLLAEGAELPLALLPDALQAELTTQMTQMRYVDRATLRSVIEEFATELDDIGLTFPGGLEGALAALEGAINPELAARLRRQSGAIWADDPWEVIADMSPERLLPLLKNESPEVAAVILSKIKISKAAELLGKLPGDRARRLTLAVSETAKITPETVRRIGLALAADLKAEPPRAFPAAAVERMGAILNVSMAEIRDDVLSGLDDEEPDYATSLRKAIFTFENIPDRLPPRDVSDVLRDVDQDTLVVLVAGGTEKAQAGIDFLLSNMSKRLAESIREGAEDLGGATPKQTEAAMLEIVNAIRARVDAGTLKLIDPDEED